MADDIATIDFETRSALDLKKVGAWKYSEHPTTDIWCLAIKVNDGTPDIWLPPHVLKAKGLPSAGQTFNILNSAALKVILSSADIVEAHNAEFERCHWKNIMVKRYGFPEILLEKFRCSAAKAAMHALPRSLGDAALALGLSQKKDWDGNRLMKKMAKPRKLVKAELQEIAKAWGREPQFVKETYMSAVDSDYTKNPIVWLGGTDEKRSLSSAEFIRWHDNPEDIIRLCEYCVQDVETEHALSRSLKDLPKVEQKIWFMDQRINERGIKIDVASVDKIINVVRGHEAKLLKEMADLVPGVRSPRQVAKTKAWLLKQMPQLDLPNMQAPTVDKVLKREDLLTDVRRVLELRQSLSKSSVSKYDAIKRMVCDDGFIRGLYKYHEAVTGRWSSKLLNSQNLPRKSYKDFKLAIEVMWDRPERVEDLFDDPIETASGLIRPMIIAKSREEFICCDFSSIEGRVLAWLAKEEDILESYREGRCAYCALAAKMYNCEYSEVYEGREAGITKYKDMRFEGKTGELACGYQGGQKAIARFAPDMERKRRERIVILWRENRQKTKSLWYGLEEMAFKAVTEPGKVFAYGDARYAVQDNFLCCRLPSGRLLYYFDPQIEERVVPAGQRAVINAAGEIEYVPTKARKKKTITHMRVNSQTFNWERIGTYGGKLVQHCTQAVARDLQAYSMLRLEKAGFKIRMHTHDESAASVKIGSRSLEEYKKIMTQVPSWAKGLPIDADGWTGKRYRK